MAINYGKAFEKKFYDDFKKLEGSSIDRLYDTTMGYKSISQISDFVAYIYPNILYIECKTHAGSSFPLSNLTQYDKLIDKVGIKGVRAGVILWFYEKDVDIIYEPISTYKKLKEDSKKSFNIKMIDDDTYPSVRCPSKKRRTFYDTDYSVLSQLPEGW